MLPKKKSRFDLLGVLDEIAEEPEAALGPKPPAPPTERLRVQLGNAWEVSVPASNRIICMWLTTGQVPERNKDGISRPFPL